MPNTAVPMPLTAPAQAAGCKLSFKGTLCACCYISFSNCPFCAQHCRNKQYGQLPYTQQTSGNDYNTQEIDMLTISRRMPP
jgi:hypothetical protein